MHGCLEAVRTAARVRARTHKQEDSVDQPSTNDHARRRHVFPVGQLHLELYRTVDYRRHQSVPIFFNYQAIYCVKASSLHTAAVHRYVDPKLDRLQLYTLTVTCVSIFYGIMLDNDKIKTADPRETSVQSVLLTGMNIAVIISIPLQFFTDTTVFDFFKDKLSCCCRRGDAAVGAAAKAAKRTSVQSCQPWLPLATTILL